LDNAESEGELMIAATAAAISVLMGVCSFMYASVIESTNRLTGNLVSAGPGVMGTTGTTGTTGVICSFFLQAVKERNTKKTNPTEKNLCFIVRLITPKIKKRHMKLSCA
jgi:hypothetical protein